MGFSNKQKKEGKPLTPDMAGYRPDKNWWPDLTAYRKAILLHAVSFDDLDALLKEYAAIAVYEKQIVCDFLYTALPGDPAWVYLEFPGFAEWTHDRNLWHYADLLIWLSQKSDREFCLAIPENQNAPLFLSTVDRQNPRGDSCVGIYADRDFYFEIPADIFEWGPLPTEPFPYAAFLNGQFGFDTRWIPEVAHCEWRKTRVTFRSAGERRG